MAFTSAQSAVRRRWRIGILLLVLVVFGLVYFVAKLTWVRPRVFDEARVLDSLELPRLQIQLDAMSRESSVDIQFVLVPTLGNEPIERFATRRMRELGVGRDTERRGLLFVYAVAEQRLRAEVGPGLEGMFPDAFVGYLIREHVRHFFGAGNPSLGVRTTLFIVHHRLREAALGLEYDPSYQGFIREARRLAAGAGASVTAPLGNAPGAFAKPSAGPGVRKYFSPQPTPAATYRRYLEWLALGGWIVDVPMFTDSSRAHLADLELTPAFNEYVLAVEYGNRFDVLVRDSLAMLHFPDDPLAQPHFFRRTKLGWQLDLMGELRNTQNVLGLPWTWRIIDSGDDFSRAFGDRFIVVGPILRIAGGDIRPLPTGHWTLALYGARPGPAPPIDRLPVAEIPDRIAAVRGRPALIILYEAPVRPARRAFADLVAFARQAENLGVRVLAFSTDRSMDAHQRLPSALHQYQASFAPVQVYNWRPGRLDSAMARVGIHVGESWTPPLVALRDAAGRVVFQAQGVYDVQASGAASALRRMTRSRR